MADPDDGTTHGTAGEERTWSRLRTLALLTLISGLVGCDHVTKHVAKTTLGDGGVEPVISNVFNLRYVENRDIAFNLLSWVPDAVRSPLLLVTGALAIVALAMLVFARRSGTISGTGWQTFAFSLVLAGAVGNYIDRVVRGYVVDFLHVSHWPVFNIADVYVTLGAIAFIVLASRSRAGPERASG